LLIDEGAWGSTKKHMETQGSIGKGWGSTMLHTKMGILMEQNFVNVVFLGVNCHFNIHVYA
jgi:hypothetical protein